MHAHPLDLYHHTDSPIHRLPAAAKLAGALSLVFTTLLIPAEGWPWLAAPAGALVLIVLLGRLPWLAILRRLLWLEPLVLSVAALSLLQPRGWAVFLLLVARSTLCVGALLLLSATTPFHDLAALLRRLRVPALLVTTLTLMHRYLAVLFEESQRMRRARASRTFTPGRARAWTALASVAGQLFVRASERAERIYAAMCARGWQ